MGFVVLRICSLMKVYVVFPFSLQLNGFVDRYSETLITVTSKEPPGKYPSIPST